MSTLPEMSNLQKLTFIPKALVEGGESMKDGLSIEQQIEKAPVDALWNKQMDWGTYKTSVYDQMAFDAQALARVEARQVAQQELLNQVVTALNNGVPLDVDYDEIERRITANLPVYVPQAREGDQEEGN
ncbi:hypothetical protein [Paenarthrobacter sp. C1]|uniref:hypothetical protein n=1 Tax=Paenarthrobacter sp. C1 TaxID=3400220 RepID=UPI003BF5BBDC